MRVHQNNKINRNNNPEHSPGLLPHRIFKRYYKGTKISIYTHGTGIKGALVYTAGSYYQYRTELIFLSDLKFSGWFAVEVYASALEAEIGHQKWIMIVENPGTTYTFTGKKHLSVNIPENIYV